MDFFSFSEKRGKRKTLAKSGFSTRYAMIFIKKQFSSTLSPSSTICQGKNCGQKAQPVWNKLLFSFRTTCVMMILHDLDVIIKQERCGMNIDFKNQLFADATMISNAFIDRFMAGASGEYVKVYLYLLRHGEENVSVESVAEALGHTEADVRRALAYWERQGVLAQSKDTQSAGNDAKNADSREASKPGSEKNKTAGLTESEGACRETAASCDMTRLSKDEPFRQLMYIAEKYLNRVLTQTDCQILGNLYSGLGFSAELLEYLIEYCVQNHHTSLRYAEKVALSWHRNQIHTVEEARNAARMYSREVYAVMKAMGLGGRNPAESELELIEKWFREYGFTKELVSEACGRTIRAIHEPSFQYADRILTDWKEAGVRTMHDVEEMDRTRREKAGASGKERRNSGGQNRPSNRFHNLEQHGYDYDEVVWNLINAHEQNGGTNGTQ